MEKKSIAGQTAGPAFLPVETPEDINLLAALADEIWHECFAELLAPAQIGYMVEKFLSPAAIAANMRDEGYLYWLVIFEGEPGGFVAVQPRDGRLLLSKLYLRAALRGAGNGAAGLRFAEQQGRALGCHSIWLTVNKGNARAIRAYRRAGYTQTRSQVAEIGGGYVMDDYVFEKPL